MPNPSQDSIEELLLSCRYGELDEVKSFVEEYGWEQVVSARDDRGNTVLHMCCGNGHAGEISAPCHPIHPSLDRVVLSAIFDQKRIHDG